MQTCPSCKSAEIHRSRTRTKFDKWRKAITGRRPYRCHACGWRGWGIDVGPKFGEQALDIAARALAPDPPNLKGTVLGRDESRPEIDLEQLDSMKFTKATGK
jgi:predicted RNA-binding Zn-ribbon protein involved in translation (DUF1610 family)